MVHPSDAYGDSNADDRGGTEDATGNESTDGPLGRRTLLKLAGATTMGGILATSDSVEQASASRTVIQKDGYEVWEISGTEVYELGDGDTLENVVVDQTEPGANFYVSAPNNPTGWTIRNVAWRGLGTVSDVSGWAGLFHMTVSGTGTIENVFIDNRDPNRDTKIGGVLLPQHHAGDVECRNTFIAGCGNNAFYGSNPGKSGGNEGTVRFYNCYHRDNTVSQFRIGTPGSLVENCVGVVNDPDGTRGTYPGTTSRRARGVWCRNMPDNTVRNSVLYVSPDDDDPWANFMVDCISKSNGPEAVLHLENTQVNADAPRHTFVPQRDRPARIVGDYEIGNYTVNVLGGGGVPLSPEMAARGERSMPPELPGADGSTSDSSTSNLDRTLTVDGSDAGWTDYEITVSGDLEKDSTNGSVNDADVVEGSTVTGFVNGGVDGYRFSGEVTDAVVDGDATVLVDGQAIDVGDGSVPDRTLTIDGSGDRADYAFTVSEALEEANGSLGRGDSIDGTSASGFVVGGADEYRFAGEVTDFGLDGDATVLVDGQAVDPSTLGDAPELSNTLTIDGSGDRADYAFTVSEALEEANGSLGRGDSIDGTSASGFVVGGADEYRFAGEVTDFGLDGDATVLVNGEVATALSLPNRLVIDGRDTAGSTTYEFSVSGDLRIDPELGATDGVTVDGSSVTSTVDDGRDAFRFSGDMTKLFIDGDADITFEDNDG